MRFILIIGILLNAPLVSAGPFIDFSSALGGPEGVLPGSANGWTSPDGTLMVRGWARHGSWTPEPLYVRNVTNDHGFGVCNRLENCLGGDTNELSQLSAPEVIVLTPATGYTWESLAISSLDSGGTGGAEEGVLYWGSGSAHPLNIGGNSQAFMYPEFGSSAVEGFLSDTGWVGTSVSIMFSSGAFGTVGGNEDYLVMGASLNPPPPCCYPPPCCDPPAVPEPATLALFGIGLLGVVNRIRS